MYLLQPTHFPKMNVFSPYIKYKKNSIHIYQYVTLCNIYIYIPYNMAYTVVSHIYTYDRAQNILNYVQPLQKLIL